MPMEMSLKLKPHTGTRRRCSGQKRSAAQLRSGSLQDGAPHTGGPAKAQSFHPGLGSHCADRGHLAQTGVHPILIPAHASAHGIGGLVKHPMIFPSFTLPKNVLSRRTDNAVTVRTKFSEALNMSISGNAPTEHSHLITTCRTCKGPKFVNEFLSRMDSLCPGKLRINAFRLHPSGEPRCTPMLAKQMLTP